MTVNNAATLEHVIGSKGQFHLRLLSGSVKVRATDGEAVRVHERSGKSLADLFAIEAADGRLSMTSPDRENERRKEILRELAEGRIAADDAANLLESEPSA